MVYYLLLNFGSFGFCSCAEIFCALLHLTNITFLKIVLRGAKVPHLVKEQIKLTILTIENI